MSSNFINSVSIDFSNPNLTLTNKIHVILFAIFKDSSTDDAFCIGSEGNFERIIDEIKKGIDSATRIIPQIVYLSETNVEYTKRFKLHWQSQIDIYLNDPQIENVEISVFHPHNTICSLPTILLNYLFFGNRVSNEISDILNQILDKPFNLNHPKVKLNPISPLSLISIDINAGIKQVQVENIPTDNDVRVAAILCEYTYYYLNKKEFDDFVVNPNSRMSFWKDRLQRYGSIKNRYEASRDEINNLKSYLKSQTYDVDKDVKEKINKKNNILLKTLSPIYGIGSAIGEISKTIINSPRSEDKLNNPSDENIDLCELWHLYENDGEYPLVNWEIAQPKDIGVIFKSNYLESQKLNMRDNDPEGISSKYAKKLLAKYTLNDKESGFSSVLYVNIEKKKCMFCTKGSDFGGDMLLNRDWLGTNLLQGVIGLSGQYTQSVKLAKQLDENIKDDFTLIFIGHSLGGGLASNNAIVTTRRHAITFNAAGLNWFRVPATLFLNNKSSLFDPVGRKKRIHPYIIKGEILNKCLRGLGEAAYGAGILGSLWGENIITPEKPKLGCGKRHGMINFMTSRTQLEKLKVTTEKKQGFSKIYMGVSYKLLNHSFGQE